MSASHSERLTDSGSSTTGAAGLFTRQASGLVRQIGIPTAVGIALGSVSVAFIFVNLNAGLISFANVDMYLPLLIGAGIWLVAMFAYGSLVEAIPRAGGEYVYLSRIALPVLGSMAGIAVGIIFMYIIAANVHVIATFVPFMLTALGSAFSSTSIANAANNVTSNTAVLLVSLGVIVIVAAAAFLSLKNLARLVLWMVLFQVVAIVVLIVLLGDHSRGDFVTALSRFSHHPGAYQAILSLAKKNGITSGVSTGSIIAVLPLAFLSYNGVLYSYYVGGELRRPRRTYYAASAISIATLVVIWVGTWAAVRHVAGLHFLQAQSNLGAVNPTAYAKVTSLASGTTGLGYGLVLAGDPITKIFIGLVVPMASLSTAIAMTAVTTRVLFALAFDRILPVTVARVSDRTQSPFVALTIVIAVAAAFAVLLVYANLSNIVALLSLFVALILVMGATAATLLAYRRPDLIKRPGREDVHRVLGIPVPTVVGGTTLVLALFMVIEVVAHPTAYGSFSFASVTTLLIVLLSGPVIYAIARTVRRRQNRLDLSMAMHELPPE